MSFRNPADALVSFYRFFEGWFFEPGAISLEELAHWRWNPAEVETKGYWYHLNSWWDQRDNPDVLLLCYEDMKADLPGTVAKIARFMGIELDNELREIVLRQSSREFMVANKYYFDDKYMRRLTEERGGLPPGNSEKATPGVTIEARYQISPALHAKLDETWRAQVEARWGFADYEELREALGKGK